MVSLGLCLQVLELTKEWTNKWNETQNILKVRKPLWFFTQTQFHPAPENQVKLSVQEETLALRKEGIGVVLDSELPHLIGIDDDLLSTGIILYHLKVRGQPGHPHSVLLLRL